MTSSADAIALMNVAAGVARRAGDTVLLGRRHGPFAVETKSTPTDMVTLWDGRSESLIVRELSERRPHDGVLAEEGSTRDSDSGIVWVVDPIDGTTNFLYNLAGFAVSIAATVDGRSIAGAVYLPATRELFVAARGAGAWLGGRRLRCSSTTEASQALIGTGFSYLAEERARQGRRVASLIEHVRDVRRLGAAAPDLCFVADGRLDAYFEENLRPWDVAAGSLGAEEAGAIVTDFTGGPASDGQILASTPGIHGAMSELLTGPLHST
ncbi:MAG: inositol monophosphatase family protein [Ilumatobacteraceae bacterium]